MIVSSRKSRCFNSSFFQLEFLRDLYSANGSPHDWLARWVLYISVESVELDRRDAVTVRGEMDVKCIVVCDPLRNWKTVGRFEFRSSTWFLFEKYTNDHLIVTLWSSIFTLFRARKWKTLFEKIQIMRETIIGESRRSYFNRRNRNALAKKELNIFVWTKSKSVFLKFEGRIRVRERNLQDSRIWLWGEARTTALLLARNNDNSVPRTMEALLPPK